MIVTLSNTEIVTSSAIEVFSVIVTESNTEDSDVKRDVLRRFLAAYPDCYLVDTQYTDYFGRNATCANDSFLVRTGPDGTVPSPAAG